jgi:hypothetical protein
MTDGSELDVVILSERLARISEALINAGQKSWWWDVTLPLLSSVVIAGLTAVLTYQITKRQFHKGKLVELENQKIQTINMTNRVINTCFITLISIKDQYRDRLTPSLCGRVLQIPEIKAARFELVDTAFLDKLFFIHPKRGDKSISKWDQVAQLEVLLTNYNSLMEIWRERNKQIAHLIQSISDSNYNGTGCIKDFHQLTSPQYTQRIIQLTEVAIHLTDEIALAMHDFLCKFPDVYKPRLNKNISKDLLLALFEFDKKNLADRAQLIQRSVDADYSVLKNFVSNEAEYEKVVMSFKPVVTTPDIVD